MNTTSPFPSGLSGWQLAGDIETHNTETVFKYMNGAAELYLAYNMREVRVARFERPNHATITSEVYRMGSSADAYGVFSFDQQDPDAGIGQGSEFGGGLLRFWKGPHFVTVFCDEPGGECEEAALAIGRRIADSLPETGPVPDIVKRLPETIPPFTRARSWFIRSHILMNQRFFIAHTNILDLGTQVDAVLGRYEQGKERLHVLLAGYPSETTARKAQDRFVAAYMPEAKEKGIVKTENGKWTAIGRTGRYAVVVFDAPDASFAGKSVSAIASHLQGEGK